MPRITLKHVVSFSSEDPKNPAENLLKPEDYYKWKCAGGGESKVVVVLQLEKATQIHSIDIGNNGSAFIEILVGRSSWDPGEEYKVLLVASSFMSPAESKSGANSTRVRIFGNEKLNKAVAAEKWDRVKVVCTQPYNKSDGYGLSFINLHSPPEEKEASSGTNLSSTSNFKAKIGKFTLREESDKDEISIGSYFAKRMQTPSASSSSTVAASARDASSSIRSSLLSSSSTSSPSSSAKSSHATTFTPKRDFSATPKRDLVERTQAVQPSSARKRARSPDLSNQPSVSTSKPALDRSKESGKGAENSKQEASKRKFVDINRTKTDFTKSTISKKNDTAPPAKKAKKRTKNRKLPFHQLMKNVTFVLSGYKNPERSDIRDKAVSMGAQYRPDWGSGCTHLICAFKNTPKFNQVLGRGKIVTHKWIKDCGKKHERLPIKEYRMDGGGSSTDTEPEEIDEPVQKSHQVPPQGQDSSEGKIKGSAPLVTSEFSKKEEEDIIEEFEDDDSKPGPSTLKDDSDSDDCDTEDELRKAREAMAKGDDDVDDEYGGTTEDESDNDKMDTEGNAADESAKPKRRPSLPELPNYFDSAHFLLYGDFDKTERRLLNRYITAYSGIVDDYMNNEIKYVISNEDWDDVFEEALSGNPALSFIRPSWIMECHKHGKCISIEEFVIDRTK